MLKRRAFVTGACLGLFAAALSTCEGAAGQAFVTKDASQPEDSSGLSGFITAVGSTALQPLVEAAAEEFMQKHPALQISVQGGGSGQGITQIAEGSVQIGNSDVFAEEKLDDTEKLSRLIDNKVAVVGMGPVVNTGVGIPNVTKDELKDIFFGNITNWSELGGPDLDIFVINRASGSGTRQSFESAIFGDEKAPLNFKPQEQDSTGAVIKMVEQIPGAISYVSFYFLDRGVSPLAIDGVSPTPDSVHTGQWPIWSYEHMYCQKDTDAATRSFIDFVLGDAVQKGPLAEMGYIAIADMQVEKDAAGKLTQNKG